MTASASNRQHDKFYQEPPCSSCPLVPACKKLKQTCIAFLSYTGSASGRYRDEDIGSMPTRKRDQTIGRFT